MTEKDIDLLTRFIRHVVSELEFIKMIRDFEPTHDVKIEIETLSRVQKILPNMRQQFIDLQDIKDKITKIERAKDDGYKKGEK